MSLAVFGAVSAPASAANGEVDLLVRNARIIDGTGNPWFHADVAIDDGKIAAIGVDLDVAARERVDAQGRVLAPGFIDVHTHIEGGIIANPRADNFLLDGVTTVITGNCGGSEVNLARWRKRLTDLGPNVATLIGHNAVRRAVMGRANRAPTAVEMSRMESLVERAMMEGALGLSTGLRYVPGTYAETDEIVALAAVAAKFDGVYATHLRDQAGQLEQSIDEAVRIGREARLPIQISHLKITGKTRWGQIGNALAQIETHRARGIDITMDAYPYEQSSTGLSVLLPAWALEGSPRDLLARLENPATHERIRSEMKNMLADTGYTDFSYARVASYSPDPERNGSTISEIAAAAGTTPDVEREIDVIIEMMTASARNGSSRGASMLYHTMSMADVETIFRHPDTAVASDGGVRKLGDGMPHPRSYGTNARVLAQFVREKRLLTLADAIRKMTSLPARSFKLHDRGIVRPGLVADLVLFDPSVVRDESTYAEPHRYSRGFDHVIVNGVLVVKDGKLTDARPGRFVNGNAAARRFGGAL